MAPLLFCVAALSVVGWGSVLARLMRLSPNNGERGILGLMAIGVTAMVIHFFLPVSIGVQATMLAFGLGALLVHRFDAGWKGAGLFSLACISVLMHDHILLSSDNGIYHMQTFLWNSGSPLTPGLANLNASFGFNSLLFLIAPVVDRIEFGWITNALAAAFVLSAVLERLRAERRNLSQGAFWFLAGVIAVFGRNAVWLGWLGVLNADGVAAALAVYCVYLWLECLHGMRKDLAPSLLALVTTFALAIKLSALPLIPAGTVAWLLSRGPRPSHRVLAFSALTGLLLMARGALISGCIVFPIPQTCVYRLPWTVYPEWTESYTTGIRSWARSPGRLDYAVVLASWDWLSPWYERNRGLPLIRGLRWTVPIGLAALLLVLLRRIRVETPLLYVAALLVCCVGWWFWAAPDPRFGAGFLASISIVSLGLALSWVRLTPTARNVAFSVLIGTLAVSAAYGATQRSDGWVPSIPVPPVKLVTGPRGITIRVTTDGPMCWDQPIPCVPDTGEDQKAFQKVRWRRLPAFQPSAEKFTITVDEQDWPTRLEVHRGPHAGQSYKISDSNVSRLFRSDFDELTELQVNKYSEVGGLTIVSRGLAEDDRAGQYQSGDDRDHLATEYFSPPKNTRLLFFAWVRPLSGNSVPSLWLQDKNGFISQAEVGLRGPDGWVLLVGTGLKRAEQVRLVVIESVGAISLIDKMLLVEAAEE